MAVGVCCSSLKRCRPRSILYWCAIVLMVFVIVLHITNLNSEDSQDFDILVQPKAQINDLKLQENGSHASVEEAECVRRPEAVLPLVHDAWYAYYKPPTHSQVYVYSAYMDDRPQNPVPQIRMLAVSTRIHNTTYCQLWYEGQDEPVVTKLTVSKNGRGHKIYRQHYDQYYFTCNVKSPRPVFVSVTSQPCEKPQSLIPVKYPPRGVEHEFGVCVPITFGTLDPYRITEWVEAHLLLGVTEISVYQVHMTEATLKPLRYYEQQGIVKLYNIPTVPRWQNTYDGNKLSSMVSLNDCMYRNMYRYKWIIDIDFDELIVPNTVRNYSALLTTIDQTLDAKHYGVMSYTFRNAYFWVGCGADLETPKNTIMLRHTRREKVNGYMFAPKTILSPLTCISLFNHYCYIAFRTKNKALTVDVPPKLGMSHHYRQIRSKRNCNTLKTHGENDLSLHRFKAPLEKRYAAIVKDMKL